MSASGGRRWWRWLGGAVLGLSLALGGALVWELETSTLQSAYIARYAGEIAHWVEDGPNPALRFPGDGPYDARLGYSQLPEMLGRLTARGYRVVAQARVSPRFEQTLEVGLFPIYDAKPQAGLRIVDRGGKPLFERRYPERVLATPDQVPRVVADALMFIENRGLLDTDRPYHNPATDWRRMGTAATRFGMRAIGDDVSVPGASTLATQIEKFRHSAQGVTPSLEEKLRQMATASVKAYRAGRETLPARQRILVDYLNGVPYSAIASRGEVHGLLDALWYWFGFDEHDLALLNEPDAAGPSERVGRVYRAALSLLIAGRGPSHYLAAPEGRATLERLTDAYLQLLEAEGLVPPWLAAAAGRAELELRRSAPPQGGRLFTELKAANAVRSELLQLLGTRSLYSLDRYDLTVRTSIVDEIQQAVTEELTRLREPQYSAAAGMTGFRLLPAGGSTATTYSFLLYEATPEGNVLRVQTDSHQGPLDVNRHTRLELGSTAKLRALVSYLAAVESAYRELGGRTAEERAAYRAAYDDPLTRWVSEQLSTDPAATLEDTLAAAMQRRYSANPGERFFTGGGLHQFSNFDSASDRRNMSVDEAFEHSVNLVFIRLMRDVVRFHMERLPHGTAVLRERGHPARQDYLGRFADHEGQVFLTRFHRKHHGRAPEQSVDLLASGARTAARLARIYRAVLPEADAAELGAFLESRLPAGAPQGEELERLYQRAAPQDHHLADLGHLLGVHPLDLWVASHLARNPESSLAHVLEASAAARQEAYRWLFRTNRGQAQDERIRIVLEADAFAVIHRDWQRLGYPFFSLVPSFATAIGSSGDNPQALAELVGVLVNDGVRRPLVTIEELAFAVGTPYETRLRAAPPDGERVLSAEVARAARVALAGVVERGTGRRVHQVFKGADGAPLPIGGKTGTGDNRIRSMAAGGQTIAARPLNRTATFVFYVGNYFGVVTAYVEGEQSASYSFTSALPAQILRHLSEVLEPWLRAEAPAPLVTQEGTAPALDPGVLAR